MGLLACLLLLAAWPARADAAEAVTIAKTASGFALEARTAPLDEVLEALGDVLDFTVDARCGPEGCPTLSGAREGRPNQLLAWMLEGQNYVILYRARSSLSGTSQIEKVILKAGAANVTFRMPSVAAKWQTGPNRSPFAGPADAALRAKVMVALDLDLKALLGAEKKLTPEEGGPFIAEGAAAPAEGERLDSLLRALPLVAPLGRCRLTSRYGSRRDPLNGRRAWHGGLDLAGVPGAPARSTAPGVVLTAGWQGDYGRLVEVDHGFGIRTRYAHLSRTAVRPGQQVAAGETLGIVGSSGRSTGLHLHYEVLVGGASVDPMSFLKAGRYK
jgi:murein DD-endopeptidase MepM/ murein hydrolase activator NlpD